MLVNLQQLHLIQISLVINGKGANAQYSNFFGPVCWFLCNKSFGLSTWVFPLVRCNKCITKFLWSDAGYQATNAFQSNFMGTDMLVMMQQMLASNSLVKVLGKATNANYSNFFGQQAGYLATMLMIKFLGSELTFGATNALCSWVFFNAGSGATGAKIQISWVRCCWTGNKCNLFKFQVRMLVLVQQVLMFKFLG
jgi:hypothetical protein